MAPQKSQAQFKAKFHIATTVHEGTLTAKFALMNKDQDQENLSNTVAAIRNTVSQIFVRKMLFCLSLLT